MSSLQIIEIKSNLAIFSGGLHRSFLFSFQFSFLTFPITLYLLFLQLKFWDINFLRIVL